jgi:hypothetical protein
MSGRHDAVLSTTAIKEHAMHPVLSLFIRKYLLVVCGALAPVVLTAFVSMPFTLGNHPGEAHMVASAGDRHMS